MSIDRASGAELYGSAGETAIRTVEPPPTRDGASGGERLANALGWLSLGLGVAGLVAPDAVARLIGIPDDEDNRRMLRVVGAREIVSGVGILTQPHPTGWVWSRVAGDLMDFSLLGGALRSEDADRGRLAGAAAAVAGIAAIDLMAGQRLSRTASTREGRALQEYLSNVNVVTIRRPPAEVYAFWRDLENLPRFMKNLEGVRVTGERTSRWAARGPAGTVVEWDAEMTDDRPNERIEWRSLPGSDVQHSGWVRFDPAPGDRGTEVRIFIESSLPGGPVGSGIAKLLNKDPDTEIKEDLRRFKQVMECGEVVISDGAYWAPTLPQRPAQPVHEGELPA